MPRRKIRKPTEKMVDASIRTLAAVVESADAPTYSRVQASRALLQKAAEEGREGQSIKYGYQPDQSVLIYRTPAELDEINRGLAGDPPLLEGRKRVAMTSTERSRLSRERKRLAAE